MANKSYRYNVVVELSIDTKKVDQGKQAATKALRNWEQEQIQSMRRVSEVESSIYKNQDEAFRRFNQNQDRFAQQTTQNLLQQQSERLRFQEAHQTRAINSTKSFYREQLKVHNQAQREFEQQTLKDLGKQKAISRDAKKVLGFAPGQIQGGLDNINKIVDKQKIVDAEREVKRLTSTTNEGTKAMGQWGHAFKGAFIGAVAGLTFSLLIGGIFGVTRGILNLGLESVKAGARLETTINSLRVFAGTTADAKRELADIDTVARSTVGLRLESAEVGYTRLRALGFQADQARSFIKELGEEKILSGATDENLERVIFNFAQIASGGQKVSQELREILTQMPSMRNAFYQAFGTLDPKKIQVFFDKDVDGAFKRLTDAMAKQQSAAGGLENAWGKMIDEFIIAGRELSMPVIPILTENINRLTKALAGSSQEMSIFAVRFANLLHADQEAYQGKSVREKLLPFFELARINDKEAREIYRRNQLGAKRKSEFLKDFRNTQNLPSALFRQEQESAYKSYLDNLENKQLEPERKQAAENALTDHLQRVQQIIQKAEQQELDRLDAYYSAKKNKLDNYYSIEIAKVQDNAEKVYALQQQQYDAQIDQTIEFYNRKIELNKGNDLEVEKLQIEGQNAVNDLVTKKEIERINFEREQANRRRENLIESNSQLIRLNELYFEKLIANASLLADGKDRIEQYYDNLRNLTKSKYELLFQDERLNQQERVNLNQQYNIELLEIKQKELDAIEDFEHQKREKYVETLEFQRKVASESLQFQAQFASSFTNDFFNPNVFSSDRFNLFRRKVSKNNIRELINEDLNKAIEKRQEINRQWWAFVEKNKNIEGSDAYNEGFGKLKSAWEAQAKAVKELEKELESLDGTVPLVYVKFEKLADQISTNNVEAFDELNKAILEHRQTLERSDALGDVEYYKTLEEFYKNAANETEDLARKADYLNKVRDYGFERQKAERKLERVDYEQAVEQAEQYRNSLEGIRKEIELLQNRDEKTLAGVRYQVQSSQLQEQRSLLREIYALEFQLASPDITAEYRVRLEVLQKQLEIRNAEVDALARLQKAQLEIDQQFKYSPNRDRADVADFLASQRGITEVISDAKINSIKAAYDGLDKVAQSLAKHFGLAADAVQDLISGLLRLGLNWIFRKLFGGQGTGFGFGGQSSNGLVGFGGNGQGFGNFGNQTVGGIGFGGAGGFGGFNIGGFPFGTPQFNPNLFAGGGVAGLPRGAYGDLLAKRNELLGPPSSLSRNSSSSSLGGLGGILPLLGVGLGSAIGGGRGAGGILGGIGGGLLGLVGGAFGSSSSAFGGLFGSIGGFLGISGAATLGIGAAIGGVLLLGSFLFGRSARRRREEKQRNQAMLDALSGLDKLIEQVNNDQIDGQSALASADQIRQQYVEQMRGLKDSKTRNIALKDVSRIDAKIAELKNAVAGQESRRQRLELFAPTFGDGGSVSRFAQNNYQFNPLGYQRGGQTLGYFPSSNEYAIYNERGSEYIFDAETTRNIGTDRLDLIRQTKGQALNSMLFNPSVKMREQGGALSFTQITQTALPSTSNAPVEVHIHVDGSPFGEMIAQALAVVIGSNNGSPHQIKAITQELENQGQSNLIDKIAELVKQKLNLK